MPKTDTEDAGRRPHVRASTCSGAPLHRTVALHHCVASAGSGTLPNLYNCTFAGACGVVVPAAGNHFIYAAQPTATITIGVALREYGLDNPAFTFIVGGMILADIPGNAITGHPGTVAPILTDVGSSPIHGPFIRTSPA